MEYVTEENYDPTRKVKLTEYGRKIHGENSKGYSLEEEFYIVPIGHHNAHESEGWCRFYRTDETPERAALGAIIGEKAYNKSIHGYSNYTLYYSEPIVDIDQIIENLNKLEKKYDSRTYK